MPRRRCSSGEGIEMRTGIVLGLLLLFGAHARAFDPDLIVLKAGEEYAGTLVEIDADSLTFRSGGVTLRFGRDEVMNLEFTRRRAGDIWETLEDIDDPVLTGLLRDSPDSLDYPESQYVILMDRIEHVLWRDGGAREARRRTAKVLVQGGKRAANEQVLYLADVERASLAFARSVTWEGTVNHIRDAAVNDLSLYSETPAYARLHQLQFAIPEAQPGAVLDHEVVIEREETDLLDPFYAEEVFGDREPVLRKSVRVTVPDGAEMLTESERIGEPVVIVNKDATRTLRWDLEGIEAVFPERLRPPEEDYLHRIAAAPRTTWAAIDSALQVAFGRALGNPGRLDRAVDQVLSGISGDRERAIALYDCVAEEIQHVPVPMDEFGYRPKTIETILENGFGNDLDKPFLLHAMFRSAGLRSQVLYIRSHAKGSLVSRVPSVAQFDRAIVLLEDSVYLDPTLDTTPFGELPSECQGVLGLLVGSGGTLITTPLAPASEESNRVTLEAWLRADGSIRVHREEEFDGDFARAMRSYKEFGPEEMDVEMELLASRLHPRARLLSYQVSALSDLDEPVRLTLDYEVERFATVAGERYISFTLPELPYTSTDVAEETRRYPLDWESREMTVYEMRIEIPEGYRVKHLPGKVECRSEHVTYVAEFKEKRGVIRFQDVMKRQSTRIRASEYLPYRACVQAMAQVPNEVIVLEKK
jgi:hypothetical protein